MLSQSIKSHSIVLVHRIREAQQVPGSFVIASNGNRENGSATVAGKESVEVAEVAVLLWD